MSSSDVYESDDDDELSDSPVITPRAERGTRTKALKNLRASLPQYSVEAYEELLHETFEGKPDPKETNFNTTQDGVVIWTPQEKRTLFEVLDRKGKNGIREIAAVITSKSELEVQEYIRLLQKGVRRQNLNDSHSRTAILGDISAAAEISDECCELLDKYAEFLCLEEQREEQIAGSVKHDGLWFINGDVAEKLETNTVDEYYAGEADKELLVQANEAMDTTFPSPIDVASAVQFFKLPTWILLSERLFMNFGGQKLEDNWNNVAFKGETPSMTADVVTEFYEMALNLTRRLVHATHFFASSRVRKNSKSSRPTATVIKASDVRSAARTLNMKSDSSDFWVGLARRCSLDVEDRRHRKGWNLVQLTHDEVEILLSQESLPKEPYERIPSAIPRTRSSSIGSDASLDPLDEDSTDSEDEHAEAVDQQQSAVEKLHCWTTLGLKPPNFSTSHISSDQIPQRPLGKRKTAEELVDWRDRTLCRSEWEEFGYEAESLEDAFQNQRKRPRLTSLRPISGEDLDDGSQEPKERSESPSNSSSDSDSDSEAAAAEEEMYPTATTTPPSTKTKTNLNPITNLKHLYHPQEDPTDLDSDPEFRPESKTKGKKKSRLNPISRTSSRKRTPVSYAPQPFPDLDFDVDMDVDRAVSDSGSGSGSDGAEDDDNVNDLPPEAEDGDDYEDEDEEDNEEEEEDDDNDDDD
ncbi:uncharacterized protein BDV14DRAFT_168894 [Aspergillus stella-maris]|uniref:uncharacterized protein n=1 Tax=Aspergillus stella-maris TaxID=1810926 RepID=UPI003CCCD452